MNPRAPLPKWEWDDEKTPPAEPSAKERALSEIEHALRMFIFDGIRTKPLEGNSSLPFSPSTLRGLVIYYRQEKLNSIETGGAFDTRLVSIDAVATYLRETFGAGHFKYYLTSGLNTPYTYDFEWRQPKQSKP